MPRIWRRFLLASLFVFGFAGCGGSDGPTGPRIADLNGTWRITYTNLSASGITCGTSAIDYTLSQSGTTFSGTSNSAYVLSCTDGVTTLSDTAVGAIITNGHISGSSVTFDLATSSAHQVGTVSGASMSGTSTWTIDLGSSGTIVLHGQFGGVKL